MTDIDQQWEGNTISVELLIATSIYNHIFEREGEVRVFLICIVNSGIRMTVCMQKLEKIDGQIDR